MAGESSVPLNASVTVGASIASYLDGSGRQHQEVVLQQQNGGSDPANVNTGNPLPVNLVAGGVAAAVDNTGFVAGTTPGLPSQGVYDDAVANLTAGNLGTPRLSKLRQLLVAVQACVNGGWTPYKLISAATVNNTLVKNAAGAIGFIQVGNNAATVAYLKLYNKATAPVAGADVPVQTYMIPGNTAGAGLSLPIPAGLVFSAGIGLSLSTGIADTDNTAV